MEFVYPWFTKLIKYTCWFICDEQKTMSGKYQNVTHILQQTVHTPELWCLWFANHKHICKMNTGTFQLKVSFVAQKFQNMLTLLHIILYTPCMFQKHKNDICLNRKTEHKFSMYKKQHLLLTQTQLCIKFHNLCHFSILNITYRKSYIYTKENADIPIRHPLTLNISPEKYIYVNGWENRILKSCIYMKPP